MEKKIETIVMSYVKLYRDYYEDPFLHSWLTRGKAKDGSGCSQYLPVHCCDSAMSMIKQAPAARYTARSDQTGHRGTELGFLRRFEQCPVESICLRSKAGSCRTTSMRPSRTSRLSQHVGVQSVLLPSAPCRGVFFARRLFNG